MFVAGLCPKKSKSAVVKTRISAYCKILPKLRELFLGKSRCAMLTMTDVQIISLIKVLT